MAKAEWGVKRICPNCGTRFYDLAADPIVCPSCESSFAPERFNERKSMTLTREKPQQSKDSAETPESDIEDEDILDDDDDDVEVDDSVLLEDEDDSEESIGEIGDVPAKKGDDDA